MNVRKLDNEINPKFLLSRLVDRQAWKQEK